MATISHTNARVISRIIEYERWIYQSALLVYNSSGLGALPSVSTVEARKNMIKNTKQNL